MNAARLKPSGCAGNTFVVSAARVYVLSKLNVPMLPAPSRLVRWAHCTSTPPRQVCDPRTCVTFDCPW
jgi:hypothetical protein